MADLVDARMAEDGVLARRIMDSPAGTAGTAEAELYRRLAPRARLYGLRHLRDEQAAADLAQQVMVMTIEHLRAGKLREPDRVASFVLGACRLTVLDLRRGQARRERLLSTYKEELPVADASVAPRFDHDRLAHCLEQLPQRERSVLLMTFYEEKSAETVGRELGVTPGNVRVIRHRGVSRLRDCVTGGEGVP